MDKPVLPDMTPLEALLQQQLIWYRATLLAKTPLMHRRAVAALRRVNDKITHLTGTRPKKPTL